MASVPEGFMRHFRRSPVSRLGDRFVDAVITADGETMARANAIFRVLGKE